MGREIVLDTETTGFKAEGGDRIVEIGCVELVNHVQTGERAQWYINPEREMPVEAFRIHGLSDAFLADKPRFAEVAEAFLAFVGEAPLVIHNAAFDVGFLNAELARLKRAPISEGREIIDTVQLARRRYPGSPAGLDALCKRFGIDNSNRVLHGALLDAQLLAECYLELLGGRQTGLGLTISGATRSASSRGRRREPRPPRPHGPTAEEQAAHELLLKALKNPLWLEN